VKRFSWSIVALLVAGCAPHPGFEFQMLAPDDLLSEINHYDLRIYAATDASCNAAAAMVNNGASPVAQQAGITNQSVMLTVAAGAKIFEVKGYSDAGGMTQIASGCTASTLEKNTNAFVTIHLVRVGGPPPRVVFGSTVLGFNQTALFIVDPATPGMGTRVSTTALINPGSDYDFRNGNVTYTCINGATSLYSSNVDQPGSETQLPTGGGSDQNPSYSPDGTKIAFVSTRTGGRQIFYFDAQDNATRVSVGSNDAAVPAWSPDSMKLAWVEVQGGTPKLVIATLGQMPKTLGVPALAATAQPVWTPDGKIIVAADGGSKDEVLVWDPSTDAKTASLAMLGRTRHLSLSPDGNVLLFVADDAGGMGDIYRYDFQAMGTRLSQLLATAADEDYPSWSPSQTQIAFTSDRLAYVAVPDGSGAKRITNSNPGITEARPLFAPVK
jgi:hypothetical protein